MSEQVDEILLEAEDKMDKAVEVAREDFSTIRTGRANPGMFAKVMVDYYGTLTPVNQLASFASPEARMMIVTPYDKSSLAAIEKAGKVDRKLVAQTLHGLKVSAAKEPGVIMDVSVDAHGGLDRRRRDAVRERDQPLRRGCHRPARAERPGPRPQRRHGGHGVPHDGRARGAEAGGWRPGAGRRCPGRPAGLNRRSPFKAATQVAAFFTPRISSA